MRPPYTISELRALARERMKEGRLPCERGVLLAGYYGVEPCALCDGQIESGEVVYEVQIRGPENQESLHFHIPCHDAWRAECATRAEEASAHRAVTDRMRDQQPHGLERTVPNDNVIVAEAQQAVAESIVTELELAMTFLDVAETTRDRKHARQSVRNAIIALRTADRFLSAIQPPTQIDAIQQRRGRLAERLRAITDVDDSGSTP